MCRVFDGRTEAPDAASASDQCENIVSCMVSVLVIQCLKIDGSFVFRDVFGCVIVLVVVKRKACRKRAESHRHREHDIVLKLVCPVKDVEDYRACDSDDVEIRKPVFIEYDLLFVAVPGHKLNDKEEDRRSQHIKQEAFGHEVFLGVFQYLNGSKCHNENEHVPPALIYCRKEQEA